MFKIKPTTVQPLKQLTIYRWDPMDPTQLLPAGLGLSDFPVSASGSESEMSMQLPSDLAAAAPMVWTWTTETWSWIGRTQRSSANSSIAGFDMDGGGGVERFQRTLPG